MPKLNHSMCISLIEDIDESKKDGQSFVYKQGFTGKSRTLTHFVAFEEYMADKAILSVSQNRREVSCWR